MKTPPYKRIALWFLTCLAAVFIHSGCGIVGIVGTPTSREKKVPAEYDLAKHKNEKLLVLVDQPLLLNAKVNLRYYLTEAINANLVAKVKIPSRNLITYRELAEFRAGQPDSSLLLPSKVGGALGADVVLLVMVEDYQVQEIADTRYYRGSLNAHVVLIETATQERLWPRSRGGKSIKVGFDVGERGREPAVKRLVSACAYCIVRCLYDCRKDKFKIFDDKAHITW